MAQLNDKTEKLIMEVIKDRTEAMKKGERDSFGDDMLGRMLAACHTSDGAMEKFGLDAVFNNCKNFFFAGQDTAANLTSFSILMFANRQDWQERARNEISEVLGERETCDFNDISRLKIVSHFLHYQHHNALSTSVIMLVKPKPAAGLKNRKAQIGAL